MVEKLKIQGLAVLAVLALGSVATATASAGEFHLSAASTVLSGSPVGTQVFKPTPEGELEISCAAMSVESTVVGKTVEEITIKPSYAECEVKGGPAIDVDFTECAYRLTASTNESEHAKLRFECPQESEHIHFKATLFGSKYDCVDILSGQEVAGLHYETTGETTEFEQKTLDVNSTASGIVTTVKGVCAVEPEIHNNGTYNGIFNLKGENTIEEPSDVSYG